MDHRFALVADDPQSVVGSDGHASRPSLDDQEVLDGYSHAVVSVVDAVGPSVVSIGVNTDTRRGEGRGSGVVISSDGYVLTNSHVIHGATAITASLTDGRRFPASVLGDDPATDLALIRVEAPALPTARLRQSARLRVGQLVIAIGNPFRFQSTVSAGGGRRNRPVARDTAGRLLGHSIPPQLGAHP